MTNAPTPSYRRAKETCAKGRSTLSTDQQVALQCETPCSSYIDVSDVHCPNQRDSTEARSSASRANSTTDVHATLEQDARSTEYLDILPAMSGGQNRFDRVCREM